MRAIEQIISKDAEKFLPADTANMLWYIWETEYKGREIRFSLNKSNETGRQNITVFADKKELKSFEIVLDTPVTSDVFIKIPRNIFIMDIRKQ